MQGYFGSQVTGQFSQYSRVWWVILQADADYRARPEDFDKVYVRSATGAMVPLSTLITTTLRRGTEDGDALQRLPGSEDHRQSGRRLQLRPGDQGHGGGRGRGSEFRFSPTPGLARHCRKGLPGSTSSLAFIFGIIVVFPCSRRSSRRTLPVAVVLTVPFAIMGALLLTWVRGLENDVYFQVGPVTLVGLSAKNAILIVEFAIERVHHGMSVREAAIEAAGLRLRAIVMTSFAFILGCVPLATASGPGANSLRARSVPASSAACFVSTLVATFFVPLFFFLLEKLERAPGQEEGIR